MPGAETAMASWRVRHGCKGFFGRRSRGGRPRIVDLLGSDPELVVVGEAGSVAEAMARIPAVRPDVAVLDVRLADGSGIELCRELLSDIPELRCLMLTSFTSDEAMLDAILAGASGYVVKDIEAMGPGRMRAPSTAADLTARLRRHRYTVVGVSAHVRRVRPLDEGCHMAGQTRRTRRVGA